MCRKQLLILKNNSGDFPGSPVVKTLCFHCTGHGFDPWSENEDPTCHEVWSKKKKNNSASEILNLRQPPSFPTSLMKIKSQSSNIATAEELYVEYRWDPDLRVFMPVI